MYEYRTTWISSEGKKWSKWQQREEVSQWYPGIQRYLDSKDHDHYYSDIKVTIDLSPAGKIQWRKVKKG